MTAYRQWEDDLIMAHYTTMGPKMLTAFIPERTPQSLGSRARILGVRPVQPAADWTPEDDRTLRRCHPDLKRAATRLPHRTPGAIRARANLLRLEFAGTQKVWQPAHDDLIRKLTPHHTDREMGAMLGRSARSIGHRRESLGIAKKKATINTFPLLGDLLAEAAARGVVLSTLTHALGFKRIQLDRKHLSVPEVAKVVDVFSGELYAEWGD